MQPPTLSTSLPLLEFPGFNWRFFVMLVTQHFPSIVHSNRLNWSIWVCAQRIGRRSWTCSVAFCVFGMRCWARTKIVFSHHFDVTKIEAWAEMSKGFKRIKRSTKISHVKTYSTVGHIKTPYQTSSTSTNIYHIQKQNQIPVSFPSVLKPMTNELGHRNSGDPTSHK